MKKRMISKANDEAKKILDSAKKEVDLIKKENKTKLDNFAKEQKDKIENEVNLLITKELASSEMEAKKMFLDEREKIINDVVNNALKKLRDEKDYEKFIEKNIKEFSSSLEKDFEILCNKKDITLIKKILTKLKLKAEVEETNIDAGLILIGSGLKVNLSIESLLQENIRSIRQKIIEIIEK